MKSRRLATALILLVPVALVAAPVLKSGMRSEIAHWHLAAAANAIELGTGDGEASIEAARAWDPEIEKLSDYWTVRVRQLAASVITRDSLNLGAVPPELARTVSSELARDLARRGKFRQAAAAIRELLGEKADQDLLYWELLVSDAYLESSASHAIELIREAIELNPDPSNPVNLSLRYSPAAKYALIFSEDEEFDAALDAYKIQFGEDYVRDRQTLNTLAYTRALALRELDQALVDINEALTYAPEDPSMRDTRAWVYYQMGRYEEALADADFAVKEFEKPTLTNWLQSQLVQAAASVPKETSGQDPTATAGNQPDQNAAESNDTAQTDAVRMDTVQTDNELDELAKGDVRDGAEQYVSAMQADPLIWTRGVIHYHRAQILEKLGRSEEARADWDFLKKHRLPPDDRLH